MTASAGSSSSGVRRRAWLAWGAVCLIWGTTYLAIKIALETIPPFLMGGLRYTTGGAALAIVLALRGHRLPGPRSWAGLAILGFFLLMLGNGGVVWGEQYVPSGLTAVLIGTSPFWMVGVDALLPHGSRLHAREWLGLTVGFGGIVLLVWPEIVRGGPAGRGFAAGVVSLQIACAGWAVGSAYTRRHVLPADVLGSAALQMIFGGAMLFVAGLATGEWHQLSFAPRTAAALVYLTVFGSLIAFAAYSYALQHLEVAVVSLYTYINPVIAVALGTLLLGEPFDARMLMAAGVILFGVMFVRPPARQRSPRRT